MKIQKEIPPKTGVVTRNAKAAYEGISDAAAALGLPAAAEPSAAVDASPHRPFLNLHGRFAYSVFSYDTLFCVWMVSNHVLHPNAK